jgi:transcriptional regulator with XRE-family HTH domain
MRNPSLGEVLQSARKRRGLSQRELAQVSAVSLSLIRKIEQGERPAVRVETLRKLAVALNIATSVLLSSDAAGIADGPAQPDAMQSVRQALQAEPDAANTDEELDAAGLRAALATAVRLYHDDRYAELYQVLPPLLRETQTLVNQADPQALAVRARVRQLVGSLATQTRVFDVAETALEGAVTDATATGDIIEAASAVITLCWLFLREGRIDEALTQAIAWADRIEPRMSRATNTELAAWGWLLLRASAAAVRDNRPGEADDMMTLALSSAVRIGREHRNYHEYFTTFGPTTVQMKRVENAIVESDPARALRLAEGVPTGLRSTSDNRNRHLLDVANARMMLRDYDQAFEILAGLSLDAPEWLRNQRYAKDVLRSIIDRRRTLTADMRSLADLIGLEY